MSRCLVLNANYEYLVVLDHWIDALGLILSAKGDTLASYGRIVRSERDSFALPAVIVMRRLVRTNRRQAVFDQPAKAVLFARDKFTCQYCGCQVGLRTGTRDHVLPRSRGGGNALTNLVTACAPCNLRKDARTPAEAGMRLLTQPRALNEEEKLTCLLRGVRSDERAVWQNCLNARGITLWASQGASRPRRTATRRAAG